MSFNRSRGKSPSSSTVGETMDPDKRWLTETYKPALEHAGERSAFITDCGIAIDPLYTPQSLARIGFNYVRDLGYPGEYPFTRGDSAAMGRTQPFVVSAYSGFGQASESNSRFRKLIDLGVDQVVAAFDLPTQCGYDSDDIMAAGEVGRVGVAIDTIADLEALFEGIPLNSIKRIGALANSIGPVVLAMFAVLGKKQGLAWSDYTVNLQNDPLKEYLARGTQILPPGPAARLAVDTVEWAMENAPGWSPMTVCYNHLNAGGAGSSWGAAMALANAVHYIDLALTRGHSIDAVAPLLHMFPDERHDFFVAVANVRALRKVWARLMKERYGATDPRSLALKTTVYGHGQETIQEPLNNLSRIAFGTLAYALGGATYVYIASYDEAVATPSEEAVRAAIRTQQIIAYEHGFLDTIDPLGGSYYVESLTAKIADEMWSRLHEIIDKGGALSMIEDGFGRTVMNGGAARRQRRIDSGERPWITVNKWTSPKKAGLDPFLASEDGPAAQVARLSEIKARRDNAEVAAALTQIEAACREGRSVMPATIRAVEGHATVGEICAVWRNVFGVFEPSNNF